MKIISINKFYWKKGGSEAVFFGEKELLESHGHQVIPFSMQASENLESEYSDYFVENVDYSSPKLSSKLSVAAKIIYSFDARKKMESLLSNVDADIAHFHIFQHQISPSVFGPLKKRNIPLVLTLHDLKPICPNYKMFVDGHVCGQCKGGKFYHCAINRCTKNSRLQSLINTVEMYFHTARGYYKSVDKFIAVSRFYESKMIEFGFPAEQVTYVPNFIDTDDFPLSDTDENYAIYFGRLSDEKGVDTLIRAAKQCPEIPVVIVGTGPEEDNLKRLVESEGVQNVRFVGFKTGEELTKLISNASFTVIPSIWYENCPMSVLEAMSMGKPVIGANIGGIPELIEPGVDGLTFEPGDENDLAEKMKYLWSDPKKRTEMGLQGREKIMTRYNRDVHYDALLNVYKNVSMSA